MAEEGKEVEREGRMSEHWDEIERGKKYERHDGWKVAVSVDGKAYAIPPNRGEARDEDGRLRQEFDSAAAAIDFVDQHHPSR